MVYSDLLPFFFLPCWWNFVQNFYNINPTCGFEEPWTWVGFTCGMLELSMLCRRTVGQCRHRKMVINSTEAMWCNCTCNLLINLLVSFHWSMSSFLLPSNASVTDISNTTISIQFLEILCGKCVAKQSGTFSTLWPWNPAFLDTQGLDSRCGRVPLHSFQV